MMGAEVIVPIIYAVGLLLLILPRFLKENNSLKLLLKNLGLWTVIIMVIVSVYFVFIRLGIVD